MDVTLVPAAGEPAGPIVARARFMVYVSTDRCFWRLLGRNNRAYGRSMSTGLSVEEVRDSAAAAARAAVEGDFDLTSSVGREWSWVLSLEGAPVARSSGTYGRRVECLASIGRFKLAAPAAELAYVRYIPRDVFSQPPVILPTVGRSSLRRNGIHRPLAGYDRRNEPPHQDPEG